MIDIRIILWLWLIAFIGGTIFRVVKDFRNQKKEQEKWKRIVKEAKLRESLNAPDTKRDETKDEIS